MALVYSLWYDGADQQPFLLRASGDRWLGGFVSLNESRADAEKHRDLLVEKYDVDPERFHIVRVGLYPWGPNR